MTALVLAVVGGAVVGAVVAALVLRRRPSADAAGEMRVPAGSSVPAAGGLSPGATDVLDALRSATVVLDDDDRVVRASPTAHLLGLVRSDRLTAEPLETAAGFVRTRGDYRSVEVEVDRGRTRGGVRVVRAEVVPLPGGLVLVTADDVTESRRLDAVRRDFVANVSHELKTPVGALSLLAEAVADAKDEPDTVERFAGRMQAEGARLTELVNELIELSRLQDPGRPLQIESVDVDAVVDEAVDAVRTAATAKDITVDRGEPSGLRLRAERAQVVTALRNLLANAVAYSPEATRVGVGVSTGDDGLVEISVTDQGVGISAEEQERVFERFYRVDQARSRGTGGTGLGLAIVKHVAARHGGEVTLWSLEGSGSTFTLRLPREARA
jgi:two-component system sensor histidine kinase SenX3